MKFERQKEIFIELAKRTGLVQYLGEGVEFFKVLEAFKMSVEVDRYSNDSVKFNFHEFLKFLNKSEIEKQEEWKEKAKYALSDILMNYEKFEVM